MCTSADFESVFVLLEELWSEKNLDPDALRRVFSVGLMSALQCYLCATEGEIVVGFCSLSIKNNLWKAGNLAHIDELIVTKQRRGVGIGRALLAAIMDAEKEAGCSAIELDSAFHRSESRLFYEREGF
jgi:GNAT superfamily N-acetyltransferase